MGTIDKSFFFNDLARWQQWVTESLTRSMRSLEIARTKPEGAQHDSNLYLAADGTLWAQYGDGWYELTRESAAPYAQYTKTRRFTGGGEKIARGSVQSVEKLDGTKLVFIKRSCDDMSWNWGWEVKKPGSWPSPHSTADYYENAVVHSRRGLELAKVLIEKRPAIEQWMDEYAKSQGELRAQGTSAMDRDWKTLIETFAPGLKGRDVPDNGSLVCSLHMVLDQIALGRQVRTYCH